WSDFSAKPEYECTYEVFALRGAPTSPQLSEKVAVKIRTESEHGRTHHVHFNRGAATSQEYTRLFVDKRPEDVGPAAFTRLSRGAAPNQLQTSSGAPLVAVERLETIVTVEAKVTPWSVDLRTFKIPPLSYQ